MSLGRNFVIAVFLLLVSCVLAGFVWGFEGKVVGISDGDTIKVMDQDRQVKVRLYGIDTPEKGQAYGMKAKEFTESQVAGEIVRVDPKDTDRYGRTVGLVYTLDGKCLNEEIVTAGFAWVYKQYCNQDFCPEWGGLEAKAKAGGKGLWADANPMAPWDYRKGGKKIIASTATANGIFHGNVKSRIFHAPGCQGYNCKNCTESFPSREAAIQAGYRPCKMCNP